VDVEKIYETKGIYEKNQKNKILAQCLPPGEAGFPARICDTLRDSVPKVGNFFFEIFSQADRGECTDHFKTNRSILRLKFAEI